MMESLGRNRWAIAEGYIPGESSFTDPALMSHETACILNAGDRTANVRITIFFSDREPVGPYLVTVAARRTLHLKFNDLNDPEAGAARHRLFVGVRIRCADRCAAHKIGLPPRRSESALDHRLCRGVSEFPNCDA